MTSNKSGGTDRPGKQENGSDDDFEHDEDDDKTINTQDVKRSPIMVNLNSGFKDMQQ